MSALALLVFLGSRVPMAAATPSLTCTGSNAGAGGVLDVVVTSAADTDSLTIAESSGNYSLSVTSGGTTSAVCTGTTYPDSGNSGFPTVEVTGSALLATDFEASSSDSGLTFEGQAGATNTLDLSSVPASQSTPLRVNVSGASVDALANDTAAVGSTTFSFQNVTTFAGSSSGWTTFIAGSSGGFTFDAGGGTTGNVLDLAAANSGLNVQVPDGTVSQLTSGGDSFSGIQTFNGPAGGASIFDAGAPDDETFNVPGNGNTLYGGSGTASFIASGNGNDFFAGTGDETFSDSGTGNTLDFYEAAASQLSPLIVNLSGSTVGGVANNTASSGSATYSFGGIQTFKGSNSGSTRFVASGTTGGYTFDSNGGEDTLDLSSWPFYAPGTEVSVPNGVAQQGASFKDFFVGIDTFDGPASGNTSFSLGSDSGYTFNGAGSQNVLDMTNAGSGVIASAAGGTVLLASGIDKYSGISWFVGSSAGDTDLDFSGVAASAGTPLKVNVSGATAGGVPDESAAVGATTYLFENIADFTGSSNGHTTFFAGSTGGFTFDGGGTTGNSLDLSAANSGLSISAPDGWVRQLTTGTDNFSGIQTFIGSDAGGDGFMGGATNGLTFDGHGNGNTFVPGAGSATFNGGSGSGNELDFAFISTTAQSKLVINLSGSPVGGTANDTATVGASTYSFSNIAEFVGSPAGNTDVIPSDAAGGFTFSFASSGNTLDASSFPSSGTTFSAVAGTVTGNGIEDTFTSGPGSFVTLQGSSAGSNDFIPGPNGGLGFIGGGPNNTLDLTNLGSNVTASVPDGTITFGGGSMDSFSGITTFVGSSSGSTTFIADAFGGFTFDGGGTGNVLDLSAAPSSAKVIVNSNTPADSGAVTGLTGGGTDNFSDIQSFTGPPTVYFGLTVAKAGNGAGTVTSTPAGITCGSTCSQNFASGTSVTLTPVAAAGSQFDGWSGACTGTGTCTVAMSATRSVTATFTTVSSYALTVAKAGNGAGAVTSSPAGIDCGATCSQNFASGTSVSLTAVAAAGSQFDGWSGACTGTGNCSVAMSATRSVTATFTTLGSYALTVTRAGTGAGTVTSSPAGIDCGSTCAYSFTTGTSVTLTPEAAGGSTFEGWSGACTGTPACTIAMTAARSVTASFAKDCVVPKVKGKSLKAAERTIRRHGCAVGKVSGAYSRTKKGDVISQKPRPGRTLAPGAKVSVVVSRGKRPRR